MADNNKHPEMYNGVVLGALLILIALVWFTIPFLISGKTLLYPIVLFVIGFVTLVRHRRS
jgi:hypothetical protein